MTGPVVSVFIAASLDGYIATPEGDLTWLEAAAGPGEDYGFDAFLASVDLLAMGRGTYDHISHLDPLPFGGRPVEVFTHRPPRPRPGVSFGAWTAREAHVRWQRAGHHRVYVDGGQLIASFLAAGLVDDLTLTTVPVLLGRGRPLFPPLDARTDLRLVGVQRFASGMLTTRYEVTSSSAAPRSADPRP